MRFFNRSAIVTKLLVVLCISIFLIDEYQQFSTNPSERISLRSSPVMNALYFDNPTANILENDLISRYGPESLTPNHPLDQAGVALRDQLIHTPYWGGIYNVLTKEQLSLAPPSLAPSLLCERIREGQLWRLFSPAVLHANAIHLLFNISWLVPLGLLIEKRIGSLHYLVQITLLALCTNLAQYLMTGFLFLGLSGVVCGLVGFVSARRKKAPWEGYAIHKSTLSIFFFFLLTLIALTIVTDVISGIYGIRLPMGFANTAHVVGLAVGYLLGTLHYFRILRP